MIAFLKGEVIDLQTESVILNANDIGYEVFCSSWTLADLADHKGSLSLWIYTHVREDLIQLFGFESKEEKQLFCSLLKVNGVGPKMAMAILSGAPYQRIFEWIETSDAKSISQLPRVGKKTAEQIILTLKGKLVQLSVVKNQNAGIKGQVTSALINLGFKPQLVDDYVSQLPTNSSVEDSIRDALTKLAQL